jgi:acyl-coenzyme A thioesterase PaaI-like protein
MSKPNRLRSALAPIEWLPSFARVAARSLVIGRVVPFVGTAGIRVEELTQEQAVFTLANRRAVQNHIRGVHAAATALLAETATGMALGVWIPDDALPLLKSMHIDYVRRADGALRAVARVPEADRQRVLAEPKGEVTVEVVVTDSAGNEPVKCSMVWAWIPKKRG